MKTEFSPFIEPGYSQAILLELIKTEIDGAVQAMAESESYTEFQYWAGVAHMAKECLKWVKDLKPDSIEKNDSESSSPSV